MSSASRPGMRPARELVIFETKATIKGFRELKQLRSLSITRFKFTDAELRELQGMKGLARTRA